MENNTKKGRSLVAFALGVILGKKGLRPLTHISYIVLLLIVFFCAQNGPINSLFTELASKSCKENVAEEYETKLLEKDKEKVALKKKIKELRKIKNAYYSKYKEEANKKISSIRIIEKTGITPGAIYYHNKYEDTGYISVVKNVSDNLIFYDSYEVEDKSPNGIKISSKNLLRPIDMFKSLYRVDKPSTDENLLKFLNKIK